MILAEPVQITRQIAQEFDRLKIKYFVGGSLASSLHGIPRATHDVDMIADIKEEHIPFLVKSLESDFYIDADMIREAIQHRSLFNVIHLNTMFKVDVFILKADKVSQKEMVRREQYQITDDPLHTLYLASAEDVILHKLYWFQIGDRVSERQWHDVIGVIQVQSETLDYHYLEQTAQNLRVGELLHQALKEADMGAASD
ncbi:MAG: hypothetical protein ABIK98_10640 [Pseudomonadota bacterium]